jgi:hypothetical protein
VAGGRFDLLVEALAAVDAIPAAERWNASTTAAAGAVRSLQDARPRALLIGIGSHAEPDIPTVEGMERDVAATYNFLTSWGFTGADVVEITSQEATRDRIVREVRSLCEYAADQLAVLYIVANGASTAFGPTLVPHDGRGAGAADLPN